MRHLRYLLAAQLLLLLALLLPLVLFMRLESYQLGLEVLSAWVIVLYCSVRLSMLAVDGSERLLSLTFWIFVYIWFGITPMLQLMGNTFPLGGTYTPGTILKAQGIVLLGLIARDAGGWWYLRSRRRESVLERWVLGRELDRNRTVVVAILAALVAILLVTQLGGFGSLITSREELFTQVLEQTGHSGFSRLMVFMTLLRVPVFVAAYLLLVLCVRFERNLYLVALCVALFALSALINNPFASPRYWFGTTLLSMLYVAVPWRNHYYFVLHTAGMVFLLLLVFPYMDLFRRSMDPEMALHSGTTQFIENADYDAFQQLMNALVYVGEHGWTFGRQVAGAVLFWVPRAIWSNKPVPSGELVGEAAGYDFLNLSQPLWGEAYLDGGVVAVALIFLGYGYLTVKLEQSSLEADSGRGRYFHLIVPLYAGFQIFLLRGALMSALAYFAPILGLVYLCTRKSVAGGTGSATSTARRPSPTASR